MRYIKTDILMSLYELYVNLYAYIYTYIMLWLYMYIYFIKTHKNIPFTGIHMYI